MPDFPIAYPTNAPGLSLPGDYNFRRDFSITQNPAGVWSYGWKDDVAGRFQLFRIPRRDLRDVEGRGDYQYFSWCEEAGREPALTYHPGLKPWVHTARDPEVGTDRIWNLTPAIAYLIPTYGEHYRENAWTCIRFTAPRSGAYEFRIQAHSFPQFERFRDTTRTEFTLLRQGTRLDERTLAPDEHMSLIRVVPLAGEETVDLIFHTKPMRGAVSASVALDVEVYRKQ